MIHYIGSFPTRQPVKIGGSINIGEGSGTPLHCSCLEIPRTEEPGGLQSMGSRRVRLD